MKCGMVIKMNRNFPILIFRFPLYLIVLSSTKLPISLEPAPFFTEYSSNNWLTESIWIRSRGDDIMNKDKGAYKLNRGFDQLITKRQPNSTKVDVT